MTWRQRITRSVVFYQWPLPAGILFAAYASTNPGPYLVGSWAQRAVYVLAAVGMAAVLLDPRSVHARNAGVFLSTIACGWRFATLILNPGPYTPTEVVAFATIHAVVAVLLVQMVVLTYPTVSLGRAHPWGK